jgi:hypothetical protein
MATLNQKLKEQSTTHPNELVRVVITSQKTASQLRTARLGGEVEAIPGLDGIYKATFTGQQLLALEHRSDIDSIEADDEVIALDEE